MGRDISYTPQQVTRALTVLAENAGNFARAADELRDHHNDPLEIRAGTLREWKKSIHAEQYRKIEENLGAEMEQQAIARQRKLINLADEKLEPLIERAGEATGENVPQALRAIADVKSKSGNVLMQLTGRPTNPRDNGSSDIVDLLKHMVDRGYLNLAPDVAASVESTAEEI